MAKTNEDGRVSTPAGCPWQQPVPSEVPRDKFGTSLSGDSRLLFERHVSPATVDLIVTSPPFGLVRKSYGNVDAHEYLAWFKPFGEAFHRALKPSGSLVINMGGAQLPDSPHVACITTKLLIMLCRECGFHLARARGTPRLPTPAEWVTVRRVRVKDAVNCIWWLSKTPWPKASNRRVLVPYSDSMKDLLNGYKAKLRPQWTRY